MNEEAASGIDAEGRSGPFGVSAAVRTHRGRVRRTNEDCWLCRPPLFAIADGLGGLAAGEVASRLAVEHLANSDPQPPPPAALVDLLQAASRAIHFAASQDEALAGMGTTCTIVLLADGQAEIAHVGDSRAYLLREGDLALLTRDHSLAQELVRVGRLTEGEALGHATRHTLTRALGAPGELEVDRASVELRPGDRLMLCSDGLSGLVDDAGLEALLEGTTSSDAAERLLGAALAAGGTDNVTVLVIDILGG